MPPDPAGCHHDRVTDPRREPAPVAPPSAPRPPTATAGPGPDAVDGLLGASPAPGPVAVPGASLPFRAVGTDRHGDPIAKLVRPTGGRIIGGVAVGIADHLHVKVLWVRLTFAVLALLSGVGVLAYALLWIFVPQSRAAEPSRPSSTERRQAIGIAAVGAALAVLGTAFGLGESVGWIVGPLGLASVGAAFIWREADDAQRQRWRRSAAGVVGESRSGVWRLIGGATLVIGGLAVFALGQFDVGATGGALVAVVLTLVGVAVIAIPWWIRLVRDLGAERREVVVAQERAEIAAHLHDSVLQTLALIQRQAGDPREVLRLSRSQERELRAWLYGPAGYATGAVAEEESTATVAAALTAAAGEVEDTYAVKVTPVVVGDTAMGGAGSDMHALVAASREAMVNAAKHAGNPDISLYAEVEDDAVTVFVRDRGVGFEPARGGADRRGLAESIHGRMDRHHGRAVVRSTPGEGTEVELSMPITRRAVEPVASEAADHGPVPPPRQVSPRVAPPSPSAWSTTTRCSGPGSRPSSPAAPTTGTPSSARPGRSPRRSPGSAPNARTWSCWTCTCPTAAAARCCSRCTPATRTRCSWRCRCPTPRRTSSTSSAPAPGATSRRPSRRPSSPTPSSGWPVATRCSPHGWPASCWTRSPTGPG